MQDTLEYPPINAPEASTALAPVAAATLDLRKVDLTDVALAQFGDWRKDVATVTANLKTLALDLTTQSKVDEAKSLRWRLIGQPRAAARTTSKELKSKLAKVSKAIGAEEEAITQAWDEAETHITPLIDARQAEIDAEKERAAAAKAEAACLEAERRQRHEDGIATLAGYVAKAQGLPAERMAAGLAFVEKIRIDAAHWQEYTERAAATLADTLDTLRAMHAAQVKAEADAAELEALRREKAERDRLERIAEDERQASLKAEREAQAAAEAAENTRRLMAEEAAQKITLNAHEGLVPADAPALCASSEPEASNGSPSGDEGTAAQEVLRAVDPATEYTEGPEAPQVLKAEAETPDATDRATPADASQSGGSMGAGQPAAAGPAGGPIATFKLGAIADRLGFTLTRAFVESLGINPVGTEKAAVLFAESEWPRLCDALVAHIQAKRGVA